MNMRLDTNIFIKLFRINVRSEINSLHKIVDKFIHWRYKLSFASNSVAIEPVELQTIGLKYILSTCTFKTSSLYYHSQLCNFSELSGGNFELRIFRMFQDNLLFINLLISYTCSCWIYGFLVLHSNISWWSIIS